MDTRSIASSEKKKKERKRNRVNQWVAMFAVAVYAYFYVLLLLYVACVVYFVTRVIHNYSQATKRRWQCKQILSPEGHEKCNNTSLFAICCYLHCSWSLLLSRSFLLFTLPVTLFHSVIVHSILDSYLNLSLMWTLVTGAWPFYVTVKIRHFVNSDRVFQYSTCECECVQND